MLPAVLAELRLLSSARLDSHILLTVVLEVANRAVFRTASASTYRLFIDGYTLVSIVTPYASRALPMKNRTRGNLHIRGTVSGCHWMILL